MDIRDFHSVCINLDERVDRWKESEKEFAGAGLKVSRFSAIKDENPIVGCALSHFGVLENCWSIGKHAMIFEDDVKFSREIIGLGHYLKALDHIKWDMLYLGANVTSPINTINTFLGRLTSAQSTHAYLMNNRFIPSMLTYKSMIGKHIDLIYSENIVPYNNCLITIPMLATQRQSYSNIENKVVNYDWMEQRYRANLEKGKKDVRG